MEKKTVLDIGNCGPDYSAIRRMIEGNFQAVVVQCDGPEDATDHLLRKSVALVTVNRKLDRDYSDGMDVVRLIKSDTRMKHIPVMLITNYDEHQQAAVKVGAEWGFGKLQLNDPETHRRLAKYLDPLEKDS